MYINKYGIIIKKLLNERYPQKYKELEKKKILLEIIQNKQIEVIGYRNALMDKYKPVTEEKMINIRDLIYDKIDEILEEINTNYI